jgi:hypothetical protein
MNKVYLVWEQNNSITSPVLLNIFETPESAEKFAEMIRNKNLSSCKIEEHDVIQ